MKFKRATVYGAASGIAMIVLILDAKTALSGAQEGVELCIRTVVPSLFPFILLSIMLTGSLTGRSIPLLRPIGKLCRIPKGAESLLLVGLLGGYPVGAQCVAQACRNGQIAKDTAHRMLGFCSNAGPAFIFGMVGPLFASPAVPWALWGIHIAAALLVGFLLPGSADDAVITNQKKTVGLSEALRQSLRVMAGICGWVVVFRVIITFCQRWFLWLLPDALQTLFIGLLELTNGCCELVERSEANAFLLCAVFLGFGGICVGMQTVSVTQGIGTGYYFPGKVLHGCISLLLSIPIHTIIFGEAESGLFPMVTAVITFSAMLIYLHVKKNNSSILSPVGV